MNFPRNEKVEVAAADGSFHTVLALADGSLMLEDAKTAMGSVEPLARFGSSAFGPVRLRALSADGVTGDWLPLGTLVRLPGFKELRCPARRGQALHADRNQSLSGRSIAATPEFDNRHRCATGVYRDAVERSPSGQRRALSEVARRSGDGADAHPAGDAARIAGILGANGSDPACGPGAVNATSG